MENPFKIISISFIISIFFLFGLSELPIIFIRFNQSEWLIAMIFAILLTTSVLVSLSVNAQKLRNTVRIQSKNNSIKN